jgi:hypothetical protein
MFFVIYLFENLNIFFLIVNLIYTAKKKRTKILLFMTATISFYSERERNTNSIANSKKSSLC